MCTPEEPNYFCPSFCRAPGPPSLFYQRTELEYLSLFEDALPGQQCGEASAVYLLSPEAAQRIKDFNPEARIIMIFREPVEFLRSYHLQMLRNPPTEGETIRDLAEAIRLEPARRAWKHLPEGCLVPELLSYSTDRLRYDEHFERFAARFPADQLLPVIYDDFRDDNLGTTQRVFRFLGVDSSFRPQIANHNVGGRALRSRRMQSLLRRATHDTVISAGARRLLPREFRKKAIRAAYGRLVFEDAPPLDPDLVAMLRRRAAPHVAQLGAHLGRDLPREWGYHDLAPAS